MKLKTCIAFDKACTKHLTGFGHPERPERITAILNALEKNKLLTKENTLKPRLAVLENLLLCHSPSYVKIVQRDVELSKQWNLTDGSFTLSTGDVQINPDSWNAALLAVGGVLTGVDAMLAGHCRQVFSVVRPPGHHACTDRGMGFCLFNNVAIGARYLQKKYGIERILIADWDVHHGNGTQEIFESDPTVFYFSTHQEGIYPGTGLHSDTGSGKGRGTKMNFPIAPFPSARGKILQAFREPLMEAMETFKPQFVFISCGFDSHEEDPLGSLNLKDEDFGELTLLLKSIASKYAEGRLLSVLEGGYNLDVLARCSVLHVNALNL